jgi:hypothetical protein
MKKFFLLATMLLISGCYMQIPDIRADRNFFKGKAEFNKNYLEAYRILRTMSTKCYEMGVVAYMIEISGEHYHDVPEAFIHILMVSDSMNGKIGEIEIVGMGERKSEITVYSAVQGYYSLSLNDVSRWLDGDKTCHNIRTDDPNLHEKMLK